MCAFFCLLSDVSQGELSAHVLLSDAAWFDLIPYVVTLFKIFFSLFFIPQNGTEKSDFL